MKFLIWLKRIAKRLQCDHDWEITIISRGQYKCQDRVEKRYCKKCEKTKEISLSDEHDLKLIETENDVCETYEICQCEECKNKFKKLVTSNHNWIYDDTSAFYCSYHCVGIQYYSCSKCNRRKQEMI